MSDLARENAALREENARLTIESERLEAECQDWSERGHAHDEETGGFRACQEPHLRAHVAALVQAIRYALSEIGATHAGTPLAVAVGILARALNAPDLAALVAREQAREAVIAASRALIANPLSYHCDQRAGLRDAFVALDAGASPRAR